MVSRWYERINFHGTIGHHGHTSAMDGTHAKFSSTVTEPLKNSIQPLFLEPFMFKFQFGRWLILWFGHELFKLWNRSRSWFVHCIWTSWFELVALNRTSMILSGQKKKNAENLRTYRVRCLFSLIFNRNVAKNDKTHLF